MKTRSKLEARSVTRRSRDVGFSLIEVLVVIAIILIIAAIAIPRLLQSRMAANEAGAVAALRTIATVQVTYNFTYQQGFAPSLAALGPPPPGNQANANQAGLVDEVLASSIRNGYTFVYVPIDTSGLGAPDRYTVNANPVAVGQTGQRYFYVDQTNVIRYAVGGAAGPNSTPIPQ